MLAKFDNPNQVDRGIATSARAVCHDNLSDHYTGVGVNVYLTFTLLIPILFMIILAVLIRSAHKRIHSIIVSSPENYPTFAGVTLAMAYLMLFVLCMDMIAVHYYRRDRHEFYPVTEESKFNIFILAITLSFDLFAAIPFFVCMIYLCCTVNKGNCSCYNSLRKRCLEKACPICTIPCFYVIFGSYHQNDV